MRARNSPDRLIGRSQPTAGRIRSSSAIPIVNRPLPSLSATLLLYIILWVGKHLLACRIQRGGVMSKPQRFRSTWGLETRAGCTQQRVGRAS